MSKKFFLTELANLCERAYKKIEREGVATSLSW